MGHRSLPRHCQGAGGEGRRRKSKKALSCFLYVLRGTEMPLGKAFHSSSTPVVASAFLDPTALHRACPSSASQEYPGPLGEPSCAMLRVLAVSGNVVASLDAEAVRRMASGQNFGKQLKMHLESLSLSDRSVAWPFALMPSKRPGSLCLVTPCSKGWHDNDFRHGCRRS